MRASDRAGTEKSGAAADRPRASLTGGVQLSGMAKAIAESPAVAAQRARAEYMRASPAVAGGQQPVQLFTDQQVNAELDRMRVGRVGSGGMGAGTGGFAHDERELETARLTVIAKENPGADAEAIRARAMELRAIYVMGSEAALKQGHRPFSKDDYADMVRGLSEEELAAAAERRKEVEGHRPKLEDVAEGDRSWANSAMNEGLNALRSKMPQFTTGHHKVSKSKLGLVAARMNRDQQARARELLDFALDAGVTAFKSLGANVSSGPSSGRRLDEHGRRLDTNREASGALTPRSSILAEVDVLLDRILATEGKPGEGLSDRDYDELMQHLSQAEKLHLLKTRGEAFDADVSMWQEVPTSPGEPSYWVKRSVAPYGLDPRQADGKSVRDLKNRVAYRGRRQGDRGVSPVPALFAGELHSLGNVTETRFKSVSFGKDRFGPPENVAENRRAWAKSGYLREDTQEGHSYRRIDPPQLIAAFGKAVTLASPDHAAGLISAFTKIVRFVERQGNNELREQGVSLFQFDKIQDRMLADCGTLAERILDLPDGLSAARDAKHQARQVLDIVAWFLEGKESVGEHAQEIADGFAMMQRIGQPNAEPLPNPWTRRQAPAPVPFATQLDQAISAIGQNREQLYDLLVLLTPIQRESLRSAYQTDIDLVLGYEDRVDEGVQRLVLQILAEIAARPILSCRDEAGRSGTL